jgi:hypothetical protein
MSKKRAATKKKAPHSKGNPSGVGQSKAGIKTIKDLDGLEELQQLKETYTDGPDEPASNVRVSNPNRNTNKPSIDKPPDS